MLCVAMWRKVASAVGPEGEPLLTLLRPWSSWPRVASTPPGPTPGTPRRIGLELYGSQFSGNPVPWNADTMAMNTIGKALAAGDRNLGGRRDKLLSSVLPSTFILL